MFEQIFETFRKNSESSMQLQQEAFKQWAQQLFTNPTAANGPSPEWPKAVQKRYLEMLVEFLNQQRESMDLAYKAGIRMIEQSFKASDAKSPEDYRRTMEDLWRTLFENFKTHSETQYRDFQKWSQKSFEMVQTGQA